MRSPSCRCLRWSGLLAALGAAGCPALVDDPYRLDAESSQRGGSGAAPPSGGSGGQAASATGGQAGGTVSGGWGGMPPGLGGATGSAGATDQGFCGDGSIDAGEECDGGAACDHNCTLDCSVLSGGYPSNRREVIDGRVHCYGLMQYGRTFSEAADACESRGGHLVTITSAAEQSVIAALAGMSEIWIGATDNLGPTNQYEGDYVWINEEPWTPEAYSFVPSIAIDLDAQYGSCSPSCAHCMVRAPSGGWHDRLCTLQYSGVCEAEGPLP